MYLLLLSLETSQQIFILPWQGSLNEILFSFDFIRHCHTFFSYAIFKYIFSSVLDISDTQFRVKRSMSHKYIVPYSGTMLLALGKDI